MGSSRNKDERECPIARRKKLIQSLLCRLTLPAVKPLERKNESVLRQSCNFTSPVVNQTNAVLQSTRDLCVYLREQACLAQQTQPIKSVFHAYDADADYGSKRKRKIDENLEHHYRNDSGIYQAIADRTQKLFGSSGGDLCAEMVCPLTVGASIIATYQQNVVPLPKKVLADLIDFLKFSPSDGAECDEVVYKQVEKSLDDLDYDTYLHWEGLWGKVRPAGQCYPKRSVYLSAVISFLLNLKWRPIIPVQANLLSPIPLKIAIVGAPFAGKSQIANRIAEFYELSYISIRQLYEVYLDTLNELRVGRFGHDLFKNLKGHEAAIHSALETGIEVSDDINMELILAYLKYQERTTRGFVCDGFPATLSQTSQFRNRLDGFDTDQILRTHKREKSKLVDDPLAPDEPVLPHCLFDLLVFLTIDDKTSLQRLREQEYRDYCKQVAAIPEVTETPMDKMQIVAAERRRLLLRRNCQEGLLDQYRRTTKTFLQLDGSRDLSSIFSDIQTALRPEIQRRFDDLTSEPSINILEGLHSQHNNPNSPAISSGSPTVAPAVPAGGPTAAPPVVPKAAVPLPKPTEPVCLYSSEGPFTVDVLKYDLQNDVTSGEAAVDKKRQITPIEPIVEPKEDDEIPMSPLVTHAVDLTLLNVADQQPTPDEHLITRKAFRKFVLGEDPTEVPIASGHNLIDESKKDHHKDVAHKKDAPKKKDDAKAAAAKGPPAVSEPAKATKGGSPVSKKAAKDVVIVDDHDEMGLLRPVRLPRKADMANSLVKQYAELMAVDEADLACRPPPNAYSLKTIWQDSVNTPESEKNAEGNCLDSIPVNASISNPANLTPDSMMTHLNNRKGDMVNSLAMQRCQQEKILERSYAEAKTGSHYLHGYPVVRMHSAKLLEEQLPAEEKLLQQLDQRFPSEHEPVLFPADKVVDYGDSAYREVILEPKDVLPTIATPDQLQPFAAAPIVPSTAVPSVGRAPTPPGALPTRAVSAVGAAPATKPEEVPPVPAVIIRSKVGPSKSRSKQAFGLSPSAVMRGTQNYHEICEWLANRWRKLEQYHGIFARQVFHEVRRLQETIIEQVDNCRKSYFNLSVSHALHFEELLYKWQVQFNSLEPVKRTRLQYKELLHGQAVDFHKMLVENISFCRQQDVSLHEEIMRSEWLEDSLAIIYNCFAGLVQLEMDSFVDTLNLLRDFVSSTEFQLIGAQTPISISIPFVELVPVDHEARKGILNSITPLGSEGKKVRPETEKDKAGTIIALPTTLRPLTQEPVTPWLIARKLLATGAAAQTDQNNPVKRGGAGKTDRRSHISVDTARKHSKTQTGGVSTSREDIEELMFKELIEKAKEAALKIQETEVEARKSRYNTRPPEEPGQAKKPPPPAKPLLAAAKNPPPPPPETAPPPPSNPHERAINDETAYLTLRLEAIFNYACLIISEIKKVAKALDTKIIQSIEDTHMTEMQTAAMLIEFVHASIENEEPIYQAMVYHENRFALSVGQFIRAVPQPVALSVPAADRPSLYNEFRKLFLERDEMTYDDLQRAMIWAVEKSYGMDLVDKGWTALDSDELVALVNLLIKPKPDKFPDGVNVHDVHAEINTALKLLGSPPPVELIKK